MATRGVLAQLSKGLADACTRLPLAGTWATSRFPPLFSHGVVFHAFGADCRSLDAEHRSSGSVLYVFIEAI